MSAELRVNLFVFLSHTLQEKKFLILHTGTLIPKNSPEKFLNSSILFDEIERIETAGNSRTAKKIQLALPKELSLDKQINIVEDFIKNNLTS